LPFAFFAALRETISPSDNFTKKHTIRHITKKGSAPLEALPDVTAMLQTAVNFIPSKPKICHLRVDWRVGWGAVFPVLKDKTSRGPGNETRLAAGWEGGTTRYGKNAIALPATPS
jgi:hypothetical protein